MNATSISSNGEGTKNHLFHAVLPHRMRTQETAEQVSLSAIRNWEKAVTGLVALPAAAALSTAAVTLLAASLVERAFEVFDMTLSDVGRRVGHDHDARGTEKDARS